MMAVPGGRVGLQFCHGGKGKQYWMAVLGGMHDNSTMWQYRITSHDGSTGKQHSMAIGHGGSA